MNKTLLRSVREYKKQSILALGAGASTKRVWPEANEDGTHRIERCENVKDVAS